MNVVAFFLFLVPATRHRMSTLNFGCILIIMGSGLKRTWFRHPGIRARPAWRDLRVRSQCSGVHGCLWDLGHGFLIFTLLLKVAIRLSRGSSDIRSLRKEQLPHSIKTGRTGRRRLLRQIRKGPAEPLFYLILPYESPARSWQVNSSP